MVKISYKKTKEHRQNLSKSLRGRKLSEEHKRKLSLSKKKWWEENKNSKKVKERNRKISISNKNKIIPDKVKQKISNTLKHKYKDNLDLACGFKKGYKPWNARKHLPEEMKLKISAKLKLITNKPEMKAKRSKIMKKLKEQGMIKSLYKCGKENPNWRGGIGNQPYELEFNSKFKRAIRKRDNFECQLCGRKQAEQQKALHVHHIDYNKYNTTPGNCISLCFRCNTKVNHNRDYWQSFFKNKLTELKCITERGARKIIARFGK